MQRSDTVEVKGCILDGQNNDDMETKKCSKCGEEKELSEFYKSSKTKTGYKCQCKECIKKHNEENKDHYKKYRAKRYLSKRKEIRQQQKDYYELNKESIKEKVRQYYVLNKRKISEYHKEYHFKNKLIIKERRYKYYQSNKHYFKRKHSEYYLNNKERHLEVSARSQKNRTERLTDWYIKALLTSNGSPYRFEDITDDMIDIKRAQIQHLRIIKELKTIINESE
jgi:hypothetical protein